MFNRRNVMATAVAGALAFSACGTSSDGGTAAVPDAPGTTSEPASEALTPTEAPATNPPATAPVETELAATAAPVTTAPVTEPPVTEPPVTEPPITEPAATVPPPAEIGGRAFAEALSAESDIATNQLPDLVVDDIRRGAKINLRNVFPADRPLLMWMWAPH